MARAGSFGRSGSFGHASPVTAVSIHGGGFRSGSFGSSVNGQHYVSSMDGDMFPTHVFYYNHYGGYGYGYAGYGYNGYGYGYGQNSGSSPAQPPPAPHTPVFAADDDMLVMDNGDIVVTLTPTAYLFVDGGHLELMGASKTPLLSLALDADFAASIQQEIDARQQNAHSEAKLRRDWLSWVNWTAAILPATKADQLEARNLEALEATLVTSKKALASSGVAAYQKPDNATLVFQSCFLYDTSIQFRLADGSFATWDGSTLKDLHGKSLGQTPPELRELFKSVLAKLATDLAADEKANAADRVQIEQYETQLQGWKSEYQSYVSGSGADYSVDYGTDEIPASQAVAQTDQEITQNAQDRADNAREATQVQTDKRRIAAAMQWFK
jgi:hypothetical protein